MTDDERQPNPGTEAPAGGTDGESESTEPASVPGGTRFAIVGLGASAGGLAAIEELLHGIPADLGAAFVVVQHLDPKRTSHLVPLLSKFTTMPVLEAQEGVLVEPGCVYVIPPGSSLTICEGCLCLGERAVEAAARMPIDGFLYSLAEDQGEHAIAVILSGAGSDGSMGLRSVQAVGGFVVVQDPATAQYDGMPRSAIATGFVDQVAPIDQIAQVLIAYLSQPFVQRTVHGAPPAQDEVGAVLSVLLARAHADFRPYKKATVVRRIERRMGIRRVQTWPEYLELLRSDPGEATMLAKDLLIRVTSFFREPDAFEALRTDGIATLVREKAPDGPIRVWVPACATGEEAFSIGMLLIEELERAGQSRRISIFATDLDGAALDVARQGLYPASIAGDVSAERLARFFTREGDHYRIEKQLRDSVVFAVQNVTADPAFSRVDLISCRNLLIYLEPDVQAKVLSLFDFALNPGGILFLGKSDGVSSPSEVFEPISKKWRVFRHRRTGRFPMLPMAGATTREALLDRAPAAPLMRRGAGDLAAVALAAALDEGATSVVAVDRAGRILFLHGPTDRYMTMPTGDPNLNLLALARGKLAGRLRGALRRAAETREPVRLGGIPVQWERRSRHVDVAVRPLAVREGVEPVFAVVLREVEKPAEPIPVEPDRSVEHDRDTTIEQLESEVRSGRDELRAATEEFETWNEELKAANEEVVSMNEELQSTNEELESSKEELQSLNEELTTVNAQLQQKLDEMNVLNDDLTNLLTATDVATVFLDSHLRVKRFTNSATGLLNLIPTDVGRPIGHLTHNFEGVDLAQAAEGVLRHLRPLEREVQARGGSWYTLRMLLYRTHSKQVDGVVITLSEVTRLKRADEASQVAASKLRVMAAEIIQTERQERQRLAKILHDHLQQLLVAAKLHTSILRRGVQGDVALRAAGAKVDELLDQSIAESRSVSVELSPPVLQEAGLVAGLGWLARRTEEQHGLHVELVVSQKERVEPADHDVRIFLFEAVRELLFNVVKHSGVRSAKVVVDWLDDQVEVRVEDEGRGFEALRGLGPADSGTGMGLLAMQTRARSLGGEMIVDSSPGQGTRVTFRAPAGHGLEQARAAIQTGMSPAPVAPTGPATAALPSGSGPIRLMLVDDHELLRRGLASLLAGETAIEVVGEASNGLDAIEVARSCRPDVIVMDVSMPKMDGVEATRRIIDESPGIRIVGLSMHDQDEMAVAIRNAGAVAFVTKGGPTEDLVSAIHAAFSSLPSPPGKA